MRKTRLVDCAPRWCRWDGREPGAEHGPADAVWFECPEGHAGCGHRIPFTPALDGTPRTSPQRNGAHWERTGDTFDTLTLSPSIRRVPSYESREAALAAGCLAEHLTDDLLCAFHGFVQGGAVVFCGDSR